MNSLGDPDCMEELSCVRQCPELRAPLVAGVFLPSWYSISEPAPEAKAERVARYRFPHSLEAYVFTVKPCPDAGRWYAWGDWCPRGRKVADACHEFLDGGGSFNSRSAAEWASHTYITHLHAGNHSQLPSTHGSEPVR